MSDTNPSGLTAADRDELALLALKRMKGFERRVLALMYGLAGVTEEADGTCHAVKVIASLCRCSEKRVAKIQQEALGKLAAVLDLEPVQAGRHLFRMGTHWARSQESGVRSQEIQFVPIDAPTSPGIYWFERLVHDGKWQPYPSGRADFTSPILGTAFELMEVVAGAGGLFAERYPARFREHSIVHHVDRWPKGWYGPAIPEPVLSHASRLEPQSSHDLPPQNAGNGILAADAALEGPGGFPDE